MTNDEIRAAIVSNPLINALVPNTFALAEALSVGRKELGEYWITDRGLVADLVMRTGGITIADSVLDKLDAAALQSRSIRAITNRLYTDPKGLNFGDPSLLGWIVAMTPVLFSEAEKDVLISLAMRDAPISEYAVRCAIFNDDGSLAV